MFICIIKSLKPIHADNQRLLSQGKQLQDQSTLESYGINKESTVFVVPPLRGGGGGPKARAIVLRNWNGNMRVSMLYISIIVLSDDGYCPCSNKKSKACLWNAETLFVLISWFTRIGSAATSTRRVTRRRAFSLVILSLYTSKYTLSLAW